MSDAKIVRTTSAFDCSPAEWYNAVVGQRLRRHPVLILVLLGAVSEIIYLAYAFLYFLTVYGNAGRPFDLEQLSQTRSVQGCAAL